MRYLLVVLCVAATPLVSQAQVYQESGGLVVVEVESAPVAGDWASQTAVQGFTGGAYYRWVGADQFNSPGQGVLSYQVNITTPGNYNLRIRNYHDNPDLTLENDCWARVDGGTWLKTYSSTKDVWNWQTRFEDGANHVNAEVILSAGVHTLQLSGRSKGFAIDRFHLYLDGVSGATNQSLPQSPTGSGPPPVEAKVEHFSLINADTDQTIPAFDPLQSGAVFVLGLLPSTNLNVQAVTSGTVGSVEFILDGTPYTTENAPPYALAGDDGKGDYNPWTPSLGEHTLTATPYAAAAASGQAGVPLTVTFTLASAPIAGDGTPPAADLGGNGLDQGPSTTRESGVASPDSGVSAGDPGGPATRADPADSGCAVSPATRPLSLLLLLVLLIAPLRRCRRTRIS